MHKLFLFLLAISIVEADRQCYSTQNGIQNGIRIAVCPTNWCKRYTGATGKIELGCDTTGDCRKIGYQPYQNEIQYCISNGQRTTCCCNSDFCNSAFGSRATFVIATSLFIFIAQLFKS